MINLLIIFALLPICTFANSPPPEIANKAYQFTGRDFYTINPKLKALVEVSHTEQNAQEPTTYLMGGPRWRAFSWLRIGAYYQLAQGIRHDNDWIQHPSGSYFWVPSKNRREHLGILEFNGKVLIPFDYSGFTSLELRARLQNNFSEDEQLAAIRPGLFHTLTYQGKPTLVLALTHEMDFPLNFSEKAINRNFTNLWAQWHFSREAVAGISAGIGAKYWTTSKNYNSVLRRHYTVTQKEMIFGLNLTLYNE